MDIWGRIHNIYIQNIHVLYIHICKYTYTHTHTHTQTHTHTRFHNDHIFTYRLEELTELSSKLVKAEIIPLISSNSLSGFLWTIHNYTGSKPTSWHAGMPGVVGAIDGTHIQIIAPSIDEDVFVNRKKVHSINTQNVFDATINILDVVAKWPGSTHDPRILMESGLRQLLERHHVPVGCLAG